MRLREETIKEMDISIIFQDSFQAFLDNIKKIIITLIPYIAVMLISAVVGLLLGGAMFMAPSSMDALGDAGDSAAGLAALGIAAVVGLGLITLSIVTAIWSFFGIYQLIVDCFNGNAANIADKNYLAIDDWGKFGQYFLLGILLFLLGIPAMIAAGIGLILLVIPGIFVMGAYGAIWLWSYNALFNGDANGPIEAITYAFKVAFADIKNLAIFIAIMVGIYIVIMIATFIMAIPAAFIPGASSLVQIVQAIVSVFLMILSTRFYFEFKKSVPALT